MPRRETHIPRIGELEVFSQQRTSGRDQGPLDYHSISDVEPVWITLESALDVALCLHETPEGIQALTDLGVLIVQGLFRLGNGHTFGNRNMSEMRRHVILFLQIVRRRFPQVYIRSSGRSDAITDRRMWGTDVDDYDPKVAARFYVRDWIVDEVIRDPSRANIFKFHLVIALAHEIVHLFVGYLTGDPNVLTPPNLSARGHGSSTAGESGNYWERTFLGGTLEMWFPRGSVEAPGSAHAYLLLETSRGPRMARRISPTYIDNMVNRREYRVQGRAAQCCSKF
ncbi:hypothetical protein BBAD15_g8209 [Beauveria bassiana D1-5]|uniref:Uncharacterized protein n=1 Tax=Beauveria bassiana D1-5 TaxID=1245745 RepID=A0A0A2W0G4_BEABA|nr:hypothetical protein BBAD15_g8209 [Beauveria bassiana D1-5]